MKYSGFRYAALAAVLAATAAPLTAAPFTYHTFLLKGQPAPQLDGLTIGDFVYTPLPSPPMARS